MKEATLVATFFLLSMVLGSSALCAQQPGGNNPGMMNRNMGSMNCSQMSSEQIGKIQAAMARMHATREKMLAAKTPAERQRLMSQHMRDMEACMRLMPSGTGMMGQSDGKQTQMGQGQMMGGVKNRGMMNTSICRSMMQEMMESMKAQMEMMQKQQE